MAIAKTRNTRICIHNFPTSHFVFQKRSALHTWPPHGCPTALCSLPGPPRRSHAARDVARPRARAQRHMRATVWTGARGHRTRIKFVSYSDVGICAGSSVPVGSAHPLAEASDPILGEPATCEKVGPQRPSPMERPIHVNTRRFHGQKRARKHQSTLTTDTMRMAPPT